MNIKKEFINEYYNGNRSEYLKARKKDYCKVQFEWSCYIDYLCKAGYISQKRYESATF